MSYRAIFFPSKTFRSSGVNQADFKIFGEGDNEFIYPVTPFSEQAWSVKKVEYLIERLQESVTMVNQERINEYNENMAKKRKEYYERSYNNARRNKRIGFVYLMKASNGVYKIGYSADPNRRIKEIRHSTPFVVEIVHSIETNNMQKLEREFHKKFDLNRVNGEWFTLDESQLQEFKSYKEDEE